MRFFSAVPYLEFQGHELLLSYHFKWNKGVKKFYFTPFKSDLASESFERFEHLSRAPKRVAIVGLVGTNALTLAKKLFRFFLWQKSR
ncbi:MAG: hypothetical protein SVR94_06975 [Pseudomonadota bacterium]|nr:hypothetical protein [Pseudomonadota bacterium]